MKKWSIGNDIRSLLLADSGITSQVGQNIYPVIAPETTTGPFIVYYRDKYALKWTKMGPTEEVCRIYVTIVADNYDEGIELAELVSDAVIGQHQKSPNLVYRADLVDSTESFEDGKYVEVLLFEII